MTEARPITELNTTALKSALMVLKTFCTQINLHQATMTAITAMPGSVAAYNVNPGNNTQASGLRKDDKNPLVDGASCPTSNATFTPGQCNGGKRDPTTPETNKENPSDHQRQKKPRRGVKVDTATKEKKDLGMFYLRNPSINPADIFPKDMPKKALRQLHLQGKGVYQHQLQLRSPQEGFEAQTQDDHLDGQSFHQERCGMVQQIPFHEDAQHHRWCKEASWKHTGSYQ